MKEVLSYFGFGPSFQRWVETIYNNALSCVFNGSKSTGYFKIEKGVRQGDPLSPYLFILCIEILAHAIRKDTEILGLPFGTTEVKQVLYADDITLLVQDIESIRRLERVFDRFKQVSGLALNKDKTKLLQLGSMQGEVYDFPFGQTVNALKILGVYFTLDLEIKENMNYKEILSKIKKLLTWWKQRDLTLMGKIQLLKTFIYSKLIYIASLTPVPGWVYNELETVVWDFIWRGKPKIKKTVLMLDYKQGGLKMMHFPSLINAQRVMWVKRLLYGKKEMKWKQYFEYSTKHVGGKFIFCCNYSIDLLNFSLPEFYIDLFRTWTETREFRGNYDNIRKEILFNNKKIRFEGRPFYSENLHLNNIFRLEHIMDRNGDLKSEAYFHSKALNYSDILIIQKIYKALPSEWKRSIEGIVAERDTDEDEMFFMKNGRRISLAMISSKDIYTVIIKNVSDKVSVREKLRNLHTREFSEKDLMAVFCRPRSSTLSCTLRDFQFRLLHGIVYVNHHLYRFKIVNDNLCSFCQKEEETYKHIFYTCEYARKVWERCSTFFSYVDIKDLSWEEIQFGIDLPDKGKAQLLNHVLILVKNLIYLGRKRKKPPNENLIRSRIEQDRVEEKRLAMLHDSLSLHLKKWENWHT